MLTWAAVSSSNTVTVTNRSVIRGSVISGSAGHDEFTLDNDCEIGGAVDLGGGADAIHIASWKAYGHIDGGSGDGDTLDLYFRTATVSGTGESGSASNGPHRVITWSNR